MTRFQRHPILLIIFIFLLSHVLSGCSFDGSLSYPNAEYLADVGELDITRLAWSPKGDQIAVTAYSNTENLSKIYILDMSTKTLRLLLETTYCSLAVGGWSPEGSRIVFSAAPGCKDFDPGIWIIHAEGKVLPEFVDKGDLASWSPFSENLAILEISSDYQSNTIHLLDLNSKQDTIVTEIEGKYVSRLSWSPDGSHLAFEISFNENYDSVDIYTLSISDGELTSLTNSNRNLAPDWSVNGDIIYATKQLSSNSSLHISKADGSCNVEIPHISDIRYPTWSPEGTQVAFIDKSGSIYMVDLKELLGVSFLSEGLVCS